MFGWRKMSLSDVTASGSDTVIASASHLEAELRRLQHLSPRTVTLGAGERWLALGIGGPWSYLWLNRMPWFGTYTYTTMFFSRPIPEDRVPQFEVAFAIDAQGHCRPHPDWTLFAAEEGIRLALHYYRHRRLPKGLIQADVD